MNAAEAAGKGDFRTAGTQLLGAAASRLRGAGSACGKGLGGVLEKGLWAYNTSQRVAGIQEKLQSGDIVGATLDTLEAAVGVRRMLQACFVAGTPLRGEFGARPIESFRVGDRIWSRDENDPQGAGGLQVVEEVFVRLGRVLWLTVNGQRIGTTSEHPFHTRATADGRTINLPTWWMSATIAEHSLAVAVSLGSPVSIH